MRASRSPRVLLLALAAVFFLTPAVNAQVTPGDVITPSNSAKVANLVSPGNYQLVRQGMVMKIVPTSQLEWPPPYKAATEQYSPQVVLTPGGNLLNYKAGLPFPLVDVNDPQAATKIMWNFEFRPLNTDDLDAPGIEAVSHRPGQSEPVEVMRFGHFGFYKSIGRTEVEPTPIDKDIYQTGLAYRFGAFPVLEPAEMRGAGIVRAGSVLPGVEDSTWEYSADSRRLRRLPASELSDSFGVAGISGAGVRSGAGGATTYASTLDPDSLFGFGAKPADYNYRLVGERSMLASVNGNSPATACAQDGGRTVCPENWQMRRLYVIEATAKHQASLGGSTIVPRRVLYIDSEGWFITAADLYGPNGQLWKTIVNFHAYSDRATPNARVAIWPYKRMFETAQVDEDLTTGFSTTLYSPPAKGGSEGWYINSGTVDKAFFTPMRLEQSH
ncbi:MAG: DUF1329 domain-containing protein [Acidobacteriota bacterium]|nr:DUF1329 domain-containing protein [Acidobacteriota bacterium]